jgi:hypothetical protein
MPRDAAMAVEWSGGQGADASHGTVAVLHPLVVGEGSGGVTGVIEVILEELEVVDAASAATTIGPVGKIVNWVTPTLNTSEP